MLGRVREPSSDPIVVALSGGVDSSVCAALLVEAGHRVVGLTLRLYDARGTTAGSGRCCGPRDIEDARAVCAHLGIPFYVVNHAEAFRRAVIDDFVAEYIAGRTPNPCVRCNERVKFGPLLRRARALGGSQMATGHYARLEPGPDGEPRLLRAVDAGKDQSYFLFAMPVADRRNVLFPLGGLTKEEVRAHARRLGLPNAAKEDSQEICFVPDGDHARFVARVAGDAAPAAGEIVDEDGTIVGHHDGVHRFTIGQRRGLGVAAPEPRYVVGVDALRRRVVIGPRRMLERTQLTVRDVRWPGSTPPGPFRASVQVRHRHSPVAARISPVGYDARVELDELMDSAAAPGQAAVFYDGPVVVGGGWLAAA